MTKPTAEMIKDLRLRHHITRTQLSESLYGIKRNRIIDWEVGRRNCPMIVWWAMKLTWDKEDIWRGEN